MLLWRAKKEECLDLFPFSEAVSCAWSVELPSRRPNFQRGLWFRPSFGLSFLDAKGQIPWRNLENFLGFFLVLGATSAPPSSCSCTSSALAIGASSITSLSTASDLPPPSLCSGDSQYFGVKYTFRIRVETIQAACFFPCMCCWAGIRINNLFKSVMAT